MVGHGGQFLSTMSSFSKFMRTSSVLALLLVAISVRFAPHAHARSAAFPRKPPGTFMVKPYLQPGPQATPAARESVVVLFQVGDTDTSWRVQVRLPGQESWRDGTPPEARRIQLGKLPPTRLVRSILGDLPAGCTFEYRVLCNGEPVFAAQGHARKPAGVPFRMVVAGDTGEGTPGEKAVASRIGEASPDLVCIVGDVTQAHGRMGEYWRMFFPVFNADTTSRRQGAPILRSTLCIAAPGNHDTAYGDRHDARNVNAFGDTMAWFMFWSLPLNGPFGPGAPNTPRLRGATSRQQAIVEAAGDAFPRMACYSYDYGDVHWLVIDSNEYVDPTDESLRAWIARDLEAARNARWRFVAMHHAPFHSGRLKGHHGRMALLSDLFEQGKVDIVFSGHVHDYERTAPLRFSPRHNKKGLLVWKAGRIQGNLAIDQRYDGVTNTRPDGVIYVVTGAGGAQLAGSDRSRNRSSWQPYTRQYKADVHSFTVVDVTPTTLQLRQVSRYGKLLDEFRVTR